MNATCLLPAARRLQIPAAADAGPAAQLPDGAEHGDGADAAPDARGGARAADGADAEPQPRAADVHQARSAAARLGYHTRRLGCRSFSCPEHKNLC